MKVTRLKGGEKGKTLGELNPVYADRVKRDEFVIDTVFGTMALEEQQVSKEKIREALMALRTKA
ncbi:MAG: hypothetical protein V4543_01955 [Bacteroidota bacterium]